MSALKSRRTAIAVFVAVVIVFSLLGCHLSLGRRVRAVEGRFFAEELTAPATQLNEAAKYANRILSVINGVLGDELYTALSDSRSALLDALNAQDIPAAHDALDALEEAANAVATAAEGVTFDTVEDLDALFGDLAGAARVARNSSYNSEVDRFMDTIANRFPTNLLRRIAFVDMPERFE